MNSVKKISVLMLVVALCVLAFASTTVVCADDPSNLIVAGSGGKGDCGDCGGGGGGGGYVGDGGGGKDGAGGGAGGDRVGG